MAIAAIDNRLVAASAASPLFPLTMAPVVTGLTRGTTSTTIGVCKDDKIGRAPERQLKHVNFSLLVRGKLRLRRQRKQK